MTKGFSLTELLIALLIVGEIATFSIPKILNSQQSNQYKAIAKEAAAAVSEAYARYQLTGSPTSTTGMSELTPYLNYVKLETSLSIDREPTKVPDTFPCGTGGSDPRCLKLHNGAILWYFISSQVDFGGTNTTNIIYFLVDPDGTYKGTPQSKSVLFTLSYHGRLASGGTFPDNTTSHEWGSYYNWGTSNSSTDPPWFNWN